MRFSFAVVSVISFASLALSAPVKTTPSGALHPGNVPMIKPAVWGSTHPSGNKIPHPAVVIHGDGNTATVAQLTHKPVPGQHVIPTGHVAPSLDKPHNGKPSHLNLNTHQITAADVQKHHGNKVNTLKPVPHHELENIRGAVAKHEAHQAAQQAAHRGALAAKQRADMKSAAHAAAEAARARNARLGHHK